MRKSSQSHVCSRRSFVTGVSKQDADTFVIVNTPDGLAQQGRGPRTSSILASQTVSGCDSHTIGHHHTENGAPLNPFPSLPLAKHPMRPPPHATPQRGPGRSACPRPSHSVAGRDREIIHHQRPSWPVNRADDLEKTSGPSHRCGDPAPCPAMTSEHPSAVA